MQTSDTSNFDFIHVNKAMLMLAESIFLSEPTVDGVIFINDGKLLSFGLLWRISLSLMRRCNQYTSVRIYIHIPEELGYFSVKLTLVVVSS